MAIQIGGTTVIDNSRNINAGIATFTGINVTGIITATSFSGDGSALTNLSAGTSNGRVYFSVNS